MQILCVNIQKDCSYSNTQTIICVISRATSSIELTIIQRLGCICLRMPGTEMGRAGVAMAQKKQGRYLQSIPPAAALVP